MVKSKLRLFAIPLIALLALCCAPVPAPALPNDRAYEKVDEPTSGETYVFLAENITNNLETSDPADRLLTADGILPYLTQGTSTTSFSIDGDGVDGEGYLRADSRNMLTYEFIVTAVEGLKDGLGNQAYTIELRTHPAADSGAFRYLGVTQHYRTERQEWSDRYWLNNGTPTRFDGEIFVTAPFVYLSNTPSYWYWDTYDGTFYTYFTSNPAGLGTPYPACTEDGTRYPNDAMYYGNQIDGKTYLINWNGHVAYLIEPEGPLNLGILSAYDRDGDVIFQGAGVRLNLVGVNAPQSTSSLYDGRSLADALRNPRYVYDQTWPTSGVTQGCASLAVETLESTASRVYDTNGGSADLQRLTLYERRDTRRLDVINGTGSGYYLSGDTVEISASNPVTSTQHFKEWEIAAGENVTIVNPTSSTTAIILGEDSSSVSVRPVFEDHDELVDDGDCTTPVTCSCGYELRAGSGAHVLGGYIYDNNSEHIRFCTNEDCAHVERESCTLSTATCLKPATCTLCGQSQGDVQQDNHEGSPEWTATETTHKQAYSCCGKVLVEGESHDWQDGVCTECGYACQHRGGSPSYFSPAICEVCGSPYGSLLVDTTAPTGEIAIDQNAWKTFLHTITFGIFFQDTQAVEITASDDSYGMAGFTDEDAAEVAYLLYDGDSALTLADLEDMAFTAYNGAFDIIPDQRLVVYARITDHAGNVTYLSSDGIVLDATPPAITGVDGGVTRYTTQVAVVSDDNLESVTLDGSSVSAGAIELAGDVDHDYAIVATDKAGNVTELTVSMRTIGSLDDQLDDIDPDSTDPGDRDLVESIKETAEQEAEHATEEERAQLESLIERCDELLASMDAAADEKAAASDDSGSHLTETGDAMLPAFALCSIAALGAVALACGAAMRRR